MALISLRRELKQAVAQEAFEQAASLRDRIYDIEHKKEPLPAVPR
jgi:protein-arginine kinase activator protein McsA